jgi:hypothetical protein
MKQIVSRRIAKSVVLAGLSLAALPLATVPGKAQSFPSLHVAPSLAPNAYGSPSFAPYSVNAVNALQAGSITNGDPTKPTYYSTVSNITTRDIVVTGFPSWHGQANPGSVYGADFANELGNRLHFGVQIISSDIAFSLNDVQFSMNSTDAGNAFQYSGDLSGLTYEARRVGINYGKDGKKGGGDDVVYMNGEDGSSLINELDYVGIGNAFEPDPSYMGSDQDKINQTVAYLDSLGSFDITTTYSLFEIEGSATVHVAPAAVPEPGALAMLGGLGTSGLGFVLRRRKK